MLPTDKFIRPESYMIECCITKNATRVNGGGAMIDKGDGIVPFSLRAFHIAGGITRRMGDRPPGETQPGRGAGTFFRLARL